MLKKNLLSICLGLCFCVFVANSVSQSTDTRNNEFPQLVIQTGNSSGVEDLWLSSDGKNLVSGSSDRVIIWDLKTEFVLRAIEDESLRGISPDEKILINENIEESSDSTKSRYSFWEIKTGRLLYTIANSKCAFNTVSGLLVCRELENGSHLLTLRDSMSGEIRQKIKTPEKEIDDFSFGIGGRLINYSVNYLQVSRFCNNGIMPCPRQSQFLRALSA